MPLTVFISCGQYTPEEKALGKDICTIVRGVGYEPYFAENQSSLKGLHENILSKLNECSGFIAVMHPRGVVSFPGGASHTRGSVWVEQEIAIAAFLAQHGGRQIEVAAFVHEAVKREGIRDLLHLNPILFRAENEILDQLPGILRKWTLVGRYDEEQRNAVESKLKLYSYMERDLLRFLLQRGETVGALLYQRSQIGDTFCTQALERLTQEGLLLTRTDMTRPLIEQPRFWRINPAFESTLRDLLYPREETHATSAFIV